MSATLHDTNLPPGAIVETYDDGGALRNDGMKLTSAAKNPWYVLATVAGEQERVWSYDRDLHFRNRRFWNGWMCMGLEQSERAALAEKIQLPVAELAPLNENELQQVFSRFEHAFPEVNPKEILPKQNTSVDLSHLYFKNILVFSGLQFLERVNFESSYFSEDVVFVYANFKKGALFDGSYFSHDAAFENAIFGIRSFFTGVYFSEGAYFLNTNFEASVIFEGAYFGRLALFANALFAKEANFADTNFAGSAEFKTAQFASIANFSKGAFKAATSFKDARFEICVPEFYHRDMHQNTTFSDDRSLWPAVTDWNVDRDKQAYTRLRQIAAGNHNPDLEHFFLRQEMRCKEHLGQRFDKLFFKAYALFSDYGISVARPMVGLGLVLMIGALAIGWHLWVPEQEGGAIIALRQALGISIGNVLPFLGVVPRIFPEFHASAPWWLNTIAVFQSLAGIVLLFFLGLGLRNRFRLR